MKTFSKSREIILKVSKKMRKHKIVKKCARLWNKIARWLKNLAKIAKIT